MSTLIPYIRRSRKDEEVVSLEDQRRAITEWAERNSVQLADFVEDKGVSGNKPVARPRAGRGHRAAEERRGCRDHRGLLLAADS